jgi:hypothetical protein
MRRKVIGCSIRLDRSQAPSLNIPGASAPTAPFAAAVMET